MLKTLQQRIHTSRTTAVMDSLYSEGETFYLNGQMIYNVALAYIRELNKRYSIANAYVGTPHYPFFGSTPPTEPDSILTDSGIELLTDDSEAIQV